MLPERARRQVGWVNTVLAQVPFDDKHILLNLLQLCQHDYSEFDGGDVNGHGLYGYKWLDHYWTESDRYPFLITVDRNIAGFALVRDRSELGGDVVPHSIAEFFVLRKYRRQGVGRDAARRIFATLPAGPWIVTQSLTNTAAQEFWRAVIGKYTGGRFTERQDSHYNIIEFTT